MKKQLLLLVMMLLPMMAMADAVEIDGIYYNLITKGKVAEVTSNPIYYYGAINIPEKVTYNEIVYDVLIIGKKAFKSCPNLTSVTIPNSVTTISEEAFKFCRQLKTINIPNSVTSIENFAFESCTALNNISIPNSVTNIAYGAFNDCTGLTSINIPNSVTILNSYTFSGCTNLNSVTIPSSVIEIRQGVFKRCNSLTTISIPNSVIDISISAFEDCTGLTSITIPNSVNYLGSYAFQNCTNLASIIIGNGIQSIQSKAFASCSQLNDVYCYAENVPNTVTDVFEGSYIDYATLHVPDSSIDLYKAAAPWKNFKTIVGLNGTTPVEPEKCATPIIQIIGGKLKLSCETEGVTFVTSYTSDGLSDSTLEDEIVLAGTTTCHVSVFATKEGYENSDVATVDVDLHIGLKGDVTGDGEVTITDAVEVVNIIMGKDE